VQAPFFIVGILILEILFGIAPEADRMTWVLENVPAWIAVVVIALTYKRFPLSRLCLWLLSIHAFILMLGGHYTYAKVPVGDWLKDYFGLARNHYDRLGHFAQGFVPAILVRELLIRTAHLRHRFWLPFLTGSVCLAFSAFYELFEWWTAVLTGEAAKDFLGTQGDIWDTQWDMFCALLGATTALLILPRIHDRSIEAIRSRG
jgi:putative membrane protein